MAKSLDLGSIIDKPKSKTKSIKSTVREEKDFEFEEVSRGYTDFYGCRIFDKTTVDKDKKENLGGLLQSISHRVSSKRMYKIDKKFMKETALERASIKKDIEKILKKHLDKNYAIPDIDDFVNDCSDEILKSYSIDKEILSDHIKDCLLSQIDKPNKKFKYRDRMELFIDEVTVIAKKLDNSIKIDKYDVKKPKPFVAIKE